MSEEPLKFLSLGLDLNRRQQGTLIVAGWVIAVSGHILWVCGWLAWLGIQSPYARADQVQTLQHNIQVSTTISIGRELKDEYKALCSAKDESSRSAIEKYIEYLQNEYFQLTSQRYPEPRCT